MKKVFTFLLFTISFFAITACVNLNSDDEVITLTDGYEVAHLGDNCNII